MALIGNATELPYVQSLFNRLPPEAKRRVSNTAGRLTLGQLLALLREAACVLTNDTGPMHMAIALQRPTVCLFGPAHPEHYGQDLEYVDIFYSQVFCSPCLYEADEPPCHGNNICMQGIRPEPVIQSVMRFVDPVSYGRTTKAYQWKTCLTSIADAPNGTPLGVVVRASLKSIEGA